jgi:uncharacterized SAM-binding protein YcdF (DUF218 family)
MVVRVRRAHRWRRLLALAAVALLVVVTVGRNVGDMLVVAREVEAPQAVVVLGSHEWERLPAAAQVAKRSPGAMVLLTEPVVPTPENCYRCADRSAWLSSLGVEPSHIETLPPRVTNTYDEASAALAYCRRHSIARLLIVTSPYHTRRALATFAAVFRSSDIVLGIYPALSSSPAQPASWWRYPYDRKYVRYELAALAWYAMRHGVSPLVSVSSPASDHPFVLETGTA